MIYTPNICTNIPCQVERQTNAFNHQQASGRIMVRYLLTLHGRRGWIKLDVIVSYMDPTYTQEFCSSIYLLDECIKLEWNGFTVIDQPFEAF